MPGAGRDRQRAVDHHHLVRLGHLERDPPADVVEQFIHLAVGVLVGQDQVHPQRPPLPHEHIQRLAQAREVRQAAGELVEEQHQVRHRRLGMVAVVIPDVLHFSRGEFRLAPFDLVRDAIQSAFDQLRLEVGDDPAHMREVLEYAEGRPALEVHEEQVEVERAVAVGRAHHQRFHEFAFAAAGRPDQDRVVGVAPAALGRQQVDQLHFQVIAFGAHADRELEQVLGFERDSPILLDGLGREILDPDHLRKPDAPGQRDAGLGAGGLDPAQRAGRLLAILD